MTTTTSRRAILAGAAALPALAASITAAAAVPAAVFQAPSIDPDAELRRLWAQYCAELEEYAAAASVYDPRRAALDQIMEPFYGAATNGYAAWGGWDAWRDAYDAAFKKAWRKHKVGGPWRTMQKIDKRCRATMREIRAIEARTPFGIGIKLAVLPPDRGDLDQEDYIEALQSALPDLDKLCGSTFATAVQS